MEERMLSELPVTDAGCGAVRFVATSVGLDAEYDHFSEEQEANVTGAIRFRGVVAYRFRNEMHSLGRAEGSYDALVEVIDSEWLRELLAIEPSGIWGSVKGKRHFAIFFSSNCYLEVIAEGFEELPPREGLLRDLDV